MSDQKLVTIKMNDTESMATSRGPVLYKRGETYDVEQWIASSLIGRGMAVQVSEAATSPSPEALVLDLDEIAKMNIGELRDAAHGFGIEGWESLKKEPLKTVITEYVLKVRGETKQPADSFEPINVSGGVQPPEFNAE